MVVIFLKKNTKSESEGGANRTYYVDEGATIIENYNETLDSATIRISHLSEPIAIEPFDKVILRDRDENPRFEDRFMCVDTYTETMTSLDPVLYTYEVTLFSQTKELEGMPLPNLSITERPDGSHHSVYYYLSQYVNLYEPKQVTRTENDGDKLIGKYRFLTQGTSNHPSVIDKFNSVDCPEMMWNNPTLREVLTDLMMVADCIPVVRNNVIDYIDLTEKKHSIDTSKLNYIQRSQSAEDYVSELKMDMQNTMQTTVKDVDISCNRIEFIPFTTDGYIVTDENLYLETQFPINKLLSVKMYRQILLGTGSGTHKAICSVDLMDISGVSLIKEKKEYDSLDIAQWAYSPVTHTIAELSRFQNFNFYFQRGTNIISGFSKLTKNFPIEQLGSTNAFYLILDALSEKKLWSQETSPVISTNMNEGNIVGNSYYSTFFEIEYETLSDMVFQASKNVAPSHQRVIIDNQTNSYVDAYNQGFMEYQKANRLGNKQLFINARYETGYQNIISIGDYYNDNIVYQTQYQIYENHIEVNCSATKDYILRDYFTGVKAHIRSWKIATGEEALTRHELNKYYLEFSFREKHGSIENQTSGLAYYFLTPFTTTSVSTVKYCSVYTVTENDGTKPYVSGGRYNLDLTQKIIGNSIVFNFGFKDNYEVGKKVSDEVDGYQIVSSSVGAGGTSFDPARINAQDWSNKYGGIKLQPCNYCDKNGEMVYIVYDFATNYQTFLSTVKYQMAELTTAQEQDLIIDFCEKPLTYYNKYSGIKFSEEKMIMKDNREQLKISTQFEFCSDTMNIAFTRKFIELQECIRYRSINSDASAFKIYYGDIADFNPTNLSLDYTDYYGDSSYIALYNSYQDSVSLEILYTHDIDVSKKAFYITYTDTQGNESIILAMAGNSKVYLNVLQTRDYNIYDSTGRYVIDSI